MSVLQVVQWSKMVTIIVMKIKMIRPFHVIMNLMIIMTYDNGYNDDHDDDDDDGDDDDDDGDDDELSVIPGSLPCHNLRDDCCARHRAFIIIIIML